MKPLPDTHRELGSGKPPGDTCHAEPEKKMHRPLNSSSPAEKRRGGAVRTLVQGLVQFLLEVLDPTSNSTGGLIGLGIGLAHTRRF
jgi:hypothetical protein